MERLGSCNFFSLVKVANGEHLLLPRHEMLRNFTNSIASNLFDFMGVGYEIKEGVTKLRLAIRGH